MTILYDLFLISDDVFHKVKLLVSVYRCTLTSFRPISHYKLHKSRNLRTELTIANRNRLMNRDIRRTLLLQLSLFTRHQFLEEEKKIVFGLNNRNLFSQSLQARSSKSVSLNQNQEPPSLLNVVRATFL